MLSVGTEVLGSKLNKDEIFGRSLFGATNCLVVSHSVTADQIIADVRTLTLLLEKVCNSTFLSRGIDRPCVLLNT